MITRQAVSRWENGETIPNTDTLKLIAETFNVSVNYLLGHPTGLPDDVAEAMAEFDRKEAAYRLRTYRHKAYYSLDREDGIEHSTLFVALSPYEIFERGLRNVEKFLKIISKGIKKRRSPRLHRPRQKLKSHHHNPKHHQHNARRPVQRLWFRLVGEHRRDPRPDKGKDHAQYPHRPVRHPAYGKV